MDGTCGECPRGKVGRQVTGVGGNHNGGNRATSRFDWAGDGDNDVSRKAEHGGKVRVAVTQDIEQRVLARAGVVGNIGENADFGGRGRRMSRAFPTGRPAP